MWSEWLETTLRRAADGQSSPAMRDSLRRVQFLWIHDVIDDDSAEHRTRETADETVD